MIAPDAPRAPDISLWQLLRGFQVDPLERVSLLHEMSQLTLRIVCRALFGADLSAQGEQVSQAWNVLNAQLVERFNRKRVLPPVLPTAYDRAFRQARSTLLGVVDDL